MHILFLYPMLTSRLDHLFVASSELGAPRLQQAVARRMLQSSLCCQLQLWGPASDFSVIQILSNYIYIYMYIHTFFWVY